MLKRYAILSLIGLVWALLLGLKGCGGPSLETLSIGMNTWPGYQIALYAQAKGIFQKHGLEVEFIRFASQQDSLRAMMGGRQDASFIPFSELLQLDPSSDPPVFILVANVSAGSDGIAARPGITAIEQLRGQKVSAQIGTLSHLILLEALQSQGLKPADVELVNVANERGAQLLEAGKISAAVLWEPILHTTAEKVGGKVIFTTAQIESLVIDGLATRGSVLAAKPEAFTRFIQAWFEVMAALEQDPEPVFKTVAQILQVDTADFAQEYAGLRPGTIAMNQTFLNQGGLQHAYAQIRKLLLSDPRHPQALRQDIVIDNGPLNAALDASP